MSNGQLTDRATLRSTFDMRWSRLCCNFVTSWHLRPYKRSKGVQSGQTVRRVCEDSRLVLRQTFTYRQSRMIGHGDLVKKTVHWSHDPSLFSRRSCLLFHGYSNLSTPSAEFTQPLKNLRHSHDCSPV
jgi:hypothetical protein